MYVDADLIIKIGAVVSVIAVLVGFAYKFFQWIERQNQQDVKIEEMQKDFNKRITEIQEEQTMNTYVLLAVLDGLKQQGCNGEVTKAHDKLSKFINARAHGIPD